VLNRDEPRLNDTGINVYRMAPKNTIAAPPVTLNSTPFDAASQVGETYVSPGAWAIRVTAVVTPET
jgi:hypothetical protein